MVNQLQLHLRRFDDAPARIRGHAMVVGLMDVGMIQATGCCGYEQNDIEYCKLRASVCKASNKALGKSAIFVCNYLILLCGSSFGGSVVIHVD